MIRKSAARFVASAGLVLLAASASAQHLRFTTGHRDIQIPEYATFRIGPFYSNVKLTESVGYRYTYGMEGRVTEQLGVRRGRIHDDGTEFPVISTLDFRNYLLITRWADADISFRAQYAYYPMNTQDDEFTFNVADEEISADINFEAYPTDYLRVRLGLAPKYVVDYVDLRGVEDDYGGQRYERFESYVELDIDWMLSRTENLGLSIDRTDIWPKDDEFKSQERTTHHGALLYERQVSPTATWGLRGDAGTTEYHESDRGDTDRYSATTFLNGEVSEMTRYTLSVGYSLAVTDMADPTVDNESEAVVGSASLINDFAPNWSHSANYTRGQTLGFSSGVELSESYGYGISWAGDMLSVRLSTQYQDVEVRLPAGAGYVNWVTTLNASHPITKFLVLHLLGTYTRRDNETAAADAPSELSSDYETLAGKIYTTYNFTPSLALHVYAEHSSRMSDDENEDWERGAAGLRLSYTHDF